MHHISEMSVINIYVMWFKICVPSVEELCELAFSHVGLDWRDYVVISDKYKRDEELNYLRGCADKLFSKINVEFEYDFEKMIREMVDYHYEKLS